MDFSKYLCMTIMSFPAEGQSNTGNRQQTEPLCEVAACLNVGLKIWEPKHQWLPPACLPLFNAQEVDDPSLPTEGTGVFTMCVFFGVGSRETAIFFGGCPTLNHAMRVLPQAFASGLALSAHLLKDCPAPPSLIPSPPGITGEFPHRARQFTVKRNSLWVSRPLLTDILEMRLSLPQVRTCCSPIKNQWSLSQG